MAAKTTRRKRAKRSKTLRYSHSKTRDRGFVTYPKNCVGKRVNEWLPGKYNSPESLEAYERSAGFFMQHGSIPPWVGAGGGGHAPTPAATKDNAGPTVEEICDKFERLKVPAYSNGEQCLYRVAMRRLCYGFGNYLAADIGRRELIETRELFRSAGNCRKTINGQITRIRSVFVWAAELEMIPDDVPAKLKMVRPLKSGEAPTYDDTLPVAADVVAKTCKHLPAEAVDLVHVLQYSGARPGELFGMPVGGIKRRSPDLWTYDPKHHKNSHHGHTRRIRFGPKSIAILKRILKTAKPGGNVFVRPKWVDPRARKRWHNMAGKPWNRDNFAKLIARTCAAHGIEHWHPHQLRHRAATDAYNRKGGNAAAAQALLGHKLLSTTQRYIEVEDQPADAAARRFG